MAEADTFKDIWEDAFKIYQEQTGRKLQNDVALQRLKSSDDLLSELESRQQGFEGFRNKHARLWSALSSCLKPLDLLGSTIQSSVTSAPFAPAVFAGALHLVRACQNVSDSYDWLEKLFGELEEYTNRLREYLKGGMSASLKKRATATLSFLLEIFGRSEKMIKTGRFRHFLKTTVFGNEKMKAALERLRTLIDSEERLVIAVTYSTTQQTAQVIGRTEQKVDASTKALEEIMTSHQTARNEEKKQAEEKIVRDLLDSPAIDKIRDIYSEYSANIVPGSGKWIQEEPLFDSWLEGEAPILWIFGGPGAGKSYLSTRIISDLRQKYPQDIEHPSPISLAYFYVKEDDQHLQDLNTILKSIAFQISVVDPIFKKHVLTIYNRNESLRSARSTWENLFLKFFGSKHNFEHSAFVVIDGLDEAPSQTRKDILGFLRSIVETPSPTTRPRLQFAILGRPELRDDIRFSRKEKAIAISSQKNHDDIDKYIQEGLKKVMILYRMRPAAAKKFAKEIRDTILAGSDGMFLWAKLMLEQIYEKERKSEILAALENAPRELDGMIQHVFERLEVDPDVNHSDLNRILAWVACTRRPLLLGELDVILRIPSGEANPALRDRLRGKFASIFTVSRLQGAEEIVDEPVSAVTEQPPPLDFLSFDSEDDSTLNEEDEDDDDGSSSSGKSDGSGVDDFALDPRLQKEFETTQVGFAHKRIKDYIVQSHFHYSSSNPGAIGVDIQKTEIEITRTLLEILCDNITSSYSLAFNLVSYAAENFMKHLELIEIASTSDTDKEAIITLLYRLFHQEECIKALLGATEDPDEERMSDRGYNEFFHTWLVSNRYTQLVRLWFREAGDIDSSDFTESELEWLRNAGSSARSMLDPLAHVAVRFWLTKTGPEDLAYLNKSEFKVWILHGYFAMNDEGEPQEDFSDFQLYQISFDKIPIDKLRSLAEFGDIEKTEHWYVGLAWIMMEAEYYDPAMELYHKSLELCPVLWVAMEGLARCLGGLGRYREAIDWMNKAEQSLPESLSWLATYFWPRVSDWKLELGDLDGAIAAAKSKYEFNQQNFRAAFVYIWLLHRARPSRSSEVIEVVEWLDSYRSTAANAPRTFLVQMLSLNWNIYEPIGLAAHDREDILDIMRDASDDGIIAADHNSNMWYGILCRINAAKFNFRYLNRIDEAMVQFEAALQLIANNFNDPFKYDCVTERSTCSTRLATIYFKRAVEAKKEGNDPEPWLTKLQSLMRFSKSLEGDREYLQDYGTGYASRIYGIWLREYEKAEESVWRECFRSSILEAVDLLDDDDPYNDQWGYASLARSLLHAGDLTNAAAALTITLKPIENSATPARSSTEEESKGDDAQQESDDDEEATTSQPDSAPISNLPRVDISTFSTFWECDGPCTSRSQDYRELHFCRICNDICFCGDCIVLMKEDKLPYKICDPGHEWLQALPIPEGTKDLAATIREGYVEIHQEWLAQLRQQWTKSST